MNLLPIIAHLAELRTACAIFSNEARFDAARLAEAGDCAASLTIDGEADTFENLTYDITDLIDRLGAGVDAEQITELEKQFAFKHPDKEKRVWLAEFAKFLEADMEEIGGHEAAEDFEILLVMVSAISRRKN